MKPSVKEVSKLRLQVFLSHNGVCSRRQAMNIIQEGRVKVNGKVIREPSTPVNETDRVMVDGKLISKKCFDYVLLNKPKGFVTTRSDRFAAKTVYDLLPAKYKHLVPVGRLDKDTEGLLMLTNDGDLTFKLTHPKFNIIKTYWVIVKGLLGKQNMTKLEKGIFIEGKKTAPAKIKNVQSGQDKTEFIISIHEGRKRQIRLMLDQIGHKVIYLKRVTQGPINIGMLKTGRWRNLDLKEIKQLKDF